jgi:hypothetical protein
MAISFRRRLSFVLPASVFLCFAALETIQINAVADTLLSMASDLSTASEPRGMQPTPARMTPADLDYKSGNCRRLLGA